MNVLVTGAAGFIASHLIEELLGSTKDNIVGIDNFFSGTKENLEFLDSMDKEKRFSFFEADVRDFDLLSKIIKENNIEQIYHLAAIASVQVSIDDPLLTNEVNLKGTLNLLEASRIYGVKKVVFASSAAVYGDDPVLPKSENSSFKPISPYGCEKLMCEQYMKLYSHLYGLQTISLRYFNVYGNRQSDENDYSGVISIFEKKFKNEEIPVIYGSGEQYRDFIHVKDVVNINIKAMNTEGISGEVFCVGTAKKTSINNLFDIMNKKYGKNFVKKHLDAKNGDILESVCDNSKIRKYLNIEKFREIDEEILKL